LCFGRITFLGGGTGSDSSSSFGSGLGVYFGKITFLIGSFFGGLGSLIVPSDFLTSLTVDSLSSKSPLAISFVISLDTFTLYFISFSKLLNLSSNYEAYWLF
jgi:hypothetical protein